MLNAKNCRLRLSTGDMDYIRFGSGEMPLVMIPGVGDGLKTVKGMALPFALLYRELTRDFTVYVFSRRVDLPPHMTTLVIGGTDDRIVTGEASREIAEKIPGSELLLYDGLGHGLYEEAPDFLRRVADFCR